MKTMLDPIKTTAHTQNMSHELLIRTDGPATVKSASQQTYNFYGIKDLNFRILVGKYNISNLELQEIHSIYTFHMNRIRTANNEIKY